MTWKSTKGKSKLIKELVATEELSYRKAEKGVNAVFNCIAKALRRGEQVEIPGGTIVLRMAKRRYVWRRLGNIATGKLTRMLVLQGRQPRRIIFRPDLALSEPPIDPTVQQQKGKFDEIVQLLVELLGYRPGLKFSLVREICGFNGANSGYRSVRIPNLRY